MIKVKIDMTGWKMWEHGVPDSRLIVIKQIDDHVDSSGRHRARWLCECNCEKRTKLEVTGESIRSGNTKSCGCLALERLVEACKKHNRCELLDEYGICYASNTNNQSFFSLEDYDKIKNFCWYEDTTTGYMKTKTQDGNFIFMHRLITDNKYKIVDHVNRNKLDNRRENLREITKRNNMLNRNGVISTNTSGYTGVYFSEPRGKWIAQICVDNNPIYLGSFLDKNDAIYARLQAENHYFGESATQRYLFSEYGIEVDNNEKDELVCRLDQHHKDYAHG